MLHDALRGVVIYISCQNCNAEHIWVGLLLVSPHVAYMGHSDLIGGVRHHGTSLK